MHYDHTSEISKKELLKIFFLYIKIVWLIKPFEMIMPLNRVSNMGCMHHGVLLF